MKSKLRLYGPRIPIAIECLSKLSENIGDDLPISGGEVSFGKYDFIFSWTENPEPEPLLALLGKIDDCLSGLPTKYSLTSESRHTSRVTAEMGKREHALHTIFSFIRIHGPSITQALHVIEQVIQEIELTSTLKSLKSSVMIGNFDYAFEWDHWPNSDEIFSVLSAIDEKIEPTGALYTITTKKVYRTDKHIDDHTGEQLIAFL